MFSEWGELVQRGILTNKKWLINVCEPRNELLNTIQCQRGEINELSQNYHDKYFRGRTSLLTFWMTSL